MSDKHNPLTTEERTWLSVESVHNQLAAVLKKGADALEPCDIGEVIISHSGNIISVPSKEQLLQVHQDINNPKLGLRFKRTHNEDDDIGDSCYICSFLKESYDKTKVEIFGWMPESLFSKREIQVPEYLVQKKDQ